MQKKKEIRKLLTGHTVVEKGIIRLAKRGESTFFASGNGILNAMVFGVKQVKKCYRVPDGTDVKRDARDALSHVGRRVDLESDPDTLACLRRNTMANQRLYTAEIGEEGKLMLSVYMGRTFFGVIGMLISLHKLASFLPEGYVKVPIEKQTRQQRRDARREKRATCRNTRREKVAGKRQSKLKVVGRPGGEDTDEQGKT